MEVFDTIGTRVDGPATGCDGADLTGMDGLTGFGAFEGIDDGAVTCRQPSSYMGELTLLVLTTCFGGGGAEPLMGIDSSTVLFLTVASLA